MLESLAVAHGLVMTSLEDGARFGMIFTPGWGKTAHEDIVSGAALERMQTSGSVQAFHASAKFEGLNNMFKPARKHQPKTACGTDVLVSAWVCAPYPLTGG